MTFTDPPGRDMNRIFAETEEIVAIRANLTPGTRVLTVQTPGRLPLFPPNVLTYFDIPSLNVYDSILPNGMPPHNNVNPMVDDIKPASFYGQVGVGLLVVLADTPIPDPDWHFVQTAGKIDIYKNETVRDRYAAITPDGGRISVDAQINRRNFRAIDIPPGSVGLSVCENHAAGWKYRTDAGPWTPLSRADDGSMSAAFAPSSAPGRMEMLYDPPELKIGKIISFVGIVAWLFFAWFQLRPRSAEKSAD